MPESPHPSTLSDEYQDNSQREVSDIQNAPNGQFTDIVDPSTENNEVVERPSSANQEKVRQI